jgi:hypothetical protein
VQTPVLPLGNVGAWVTEVIDGDWTNPDTGEEFDGRATAAAGPTPDAAADA